MSLTKKQRITVKHKNPNPLFEQWLTEWRDKAKENNSKMQHCFSLALNSIKKYPLPLETGRDCKLLRGFGDKLCSMLDKKLKDYRGNNENLPILPNNVETNKKTPVKDRTSKLVEYIPKYKSGPYAILVALHELSLEANYAGYSSKIEIIKYGQKYSEKSFTKPEIGTHYTAWSSMKTLLDKGLVLKKSNPAKFSLTNQGIALSEKLYVQAKVDKFTGDIKDNKVETNAPISSTFNTIDTNFACSSKNLLAKQPLSSSIAPSSKDFPMEQLIFLPNTFEVVLLVDVSETAGGKVKPEQDAILSDLINLRIPHQVCKLNVGDYAWICRDTSHLELVLPYIVERKRIDDLGKSIIDGRFREQKFRLKQCGIQNIIYLIENYDHKYSGLPITSLFQAATNTAVQDGFVVKFTENVRGTVEYLASMTNLLRKNYQAKTVVSCPKENLSNININDDLVSLMHFKEFNKSSVKNKHFKIKDLFIKQLLQINGMSVDKAVAIVDKYPTPKLLKLAYRENESNGEKLLANLDNGNLKKKIGPILSKIIYQYFCYDNYS